MILGMIAAVLALLAVGPVLAQQLPDFLFVDETGTLDRARIEQAAQPLINRYDATVAIYMVNQGSEQDFLQRMDNDDLVNNDGNPWQDMITIYAAPDSVFMRFDAHWDSALMVDGIYQRILQTHLTPALAAGDPTTGFVNTLAAIEQALDSPPVYDKDPNNIFLWSVAAGLVVFTIVVVGVGVVKQRQMRAQAAE
jgi:uncharacterized membrane protein YgcG